MSNKEKEEHDFLTEEMTKVKNLYQMMKTPVLNRDFRVVYKHSKLSHFCNFCYMDFIEPNNSSPYHGFEYFRHLAGKKHEKEVEKYLKRTHSKFPSLRTRFKKKHFKFTHNSFVQVRVLIFSFLLNM